MALGPPVPTTAFVVVYNPTQYINSITNGQSAERTDALKHLLECIIQSDVDLITLGSIWLCVTGLLTNEEQTSKFNLETRRCAWECALELVKIEQLQRPFFKSWLSFDFLARYKIVHDVDAIFWLECFHCLTNDGKNIDFVDARLRGRLLVQFINGILTGPMSRNAQASNTLKDLLTIHIQLRHDELYLLFETIFRHLNRDDDDTNPDSDHQLNQMSIRKSIDFLCWLIDFHSLDTILLHYFIQNVVDLHDKYKFSNELNTELLQLITNHLSKAPWHNTSVIAVLCGIVVERLETPINNDIDPLSTLLFVLTQTLIDIRQHLSINQNHVQISNDDVIHRRSFLNIIRQMPICWLTILHQVLIKRPNVNMILINFRQFLKTIEIGSTTCALKIFDMGIWKLMNEIMKISHRFVMIEQKSTTNTRMIYEDCLSIFEDLATKLCCLPQKMVAQLFDLKQLTSLTRTNLREQMIKEASIKLLRLLRPNNPEWSVSQRDLIDIVLNANENVATRVDVLTTIFDKYLWFKMTDQVSQMGQIIVEALETLIHIDLKATDELEFVKRNFLMKQTAIKAIFTHFLSDHSIDSHIANHCYRILQEIIDDEINSIHQQMIEFILEQLCFLFETNLTYNRLTSFNHCSFILKFFSKLFATKYNFLVSSIPSRYRILIWQNFLHLRLRSTDRCLGMSSTSNDQIVYGTYRYFNVESEQKLGENEKPLHLRGYLLKIVNYLEQESAEVLVIILNYIKNFLKEPSMVELSGFHINQFVSYLMDLLETNSTDPLVASAAFQCLIICTSYKCQILSIDRLIDCFICALNSSKIPFSFSVQALTVSLSNLHVEIQRFISRIVTSLYKRLTEDSRQSENILEFLMQLLFNNNLDQSLISEIFRILLYIIGQSQNETAHNLLLAHTIVCFYFHQLSTNDRQLFSYLILRSIQPNSTILRDSESSLVDRPTRLQRSGSLSSLNDDLHNNDPMKRKMTVLETPPVPLTPTADENNPIQKLNDDLIRITTNFINDQFFPTNFPETIFICLPREVRRHHLNQSWLADEKFLYQIRSFDFTELNRAKEILTEFNCDVDDSMKNRHRRFTDGNKKPVQIRRADRSTLVTCQDDLHIRTFDSDTNRSLFNERNLWIPVTVRSTTSTKTFFVINSTASAGLVEKRNSQFHWFEGIQINETGSKEIFAKMNLTDEWQEETDGFFLNHVALKIDFQAILRNIDRKEEETLLNRHNENHFPQKIYRVPTEARKSIETIDHVDPVRVAKIGVVFIGCGQEITEGNILSNIRTSTRYQRFMSRLATLRSIKDLQEENFYAPLLDANNPDKCGQYAYVWQNSVYQVLFHAASMIPNTRPDHEFKKKLIGNDYVIIAFNESHQTFDVKTMKTGVCQYVIEVCPQNDSNYTRVRLRRKTSSNSTNDQEKLLIDVDYLISNDHVESYVRVLALHLSQQSELNTRHHHHSSPFLISSWQNRFQALKSLQTRCLLSYSHQP